ncbi:MAG: molybdenum cofactor biosynthesis F family protein [Oscillospiraceae bacterium]|nr:molybdenum cofactor biosynthesis F family protein [Oscillospiraceae bacterium]
MSTLNTLLRPYRARAINPEMTEAEVFDIASKTSEYNIGGLIGRRPEFYDKLPERFRDQTITLRFDNGGPVLTHRFIDAHRLLWSEGGSGVEAYREEYYEALQIDTDVFLLAYLRKGSRPVTSITIALDFGMNLTTVIKGAIGTEFSARDVSQYIGHGVIERDGAPVPLAWRHQPTRDLVGRSFGWSYRDDMTSQHIYGAPSSIAWVILQGPGCGLLGTAPCKYFRLNEHLYLYTWVESMGSGQQGVVLMNLRTMHDVGTFYGFPDTKTFEFYTYGAKGYDLGSYNTRDLFPW